MKLVVLFGYVFERCTNANTFAYSEIAVTQAASSPEDAFFDLTANSIHGVILLLTAVKIAF